LQNPCSALGFAILAIGSGWEDFSQSAELDLMAGIMHRFSVGKTIDLRSSIALALVPKWKHW